MNTQGINSQVSWAEFVRITQQARIRNSGLSDNVNRVHDVEKRERTNPYKSVQKAPVENSLYTSSPTTKAKIKISGGLFDAYA